MRCTQATAHERALRTREPGRTHQFAERDVREQWPYPTLVLHDIGSHLLASAVPAALGSVLLNERGGALSVGVPAVARISSVKSFASHYVVARKKRATYVAGKRNPTSREGMRLSSNPLPTVLSGTSRQST